MSEPAAVITRPQPGAEHLGGRRGDRASTLQGGGRASPLFIMFNMLLLINSNK